MDSTPASRSGPPTWLVRGTAPVARLLAGRRWFPIWAIVHHRGRRSGTAYEVPVAIVPGSGSGTFLIGLPWGPSTNWARNVLAAGSATVTWKGKDWLATNPRLIGPDEAAPLARPALRRLIGSGRFPVFLLLDR
ncbi:conserved hypothetical protein [Nostocoides japonicum T1-X7]|uniref:Nitroreductase family deazaflavin-dependent oxidoreductase n=1 Tax=Nostocoides japonicum T1-X7 TaxID=1194083 RepID=A0A077LW27_9MICO|nr:nitroreductase family deazaflavin-dependent oxidoreductase [Tetrasphaera japonica]CCH76169.1 conserved hypothetical protein [Tetrasphaera japonica T1-X7]